MDDDARAVIRQAQLIAYQASWHIMEQAALARLAGTPGLQRAPLVPRSEVIQLVTYDGEHLGHIRRETTSGTGETWMAVLRPPCRTAGRYLTAADAAQALVIACGKHIRHLSWPRSTPGGTRSCLSGPQPSTVTADTCTSK